MATTRVLYVQSNFVEMYKKKPTPKGGSSTGQMDLDKEFDIEKILKDIEFLGSSRMTWKERKALENRRVVSLGGKPQKNQRIPLSVARVTMKKQKEREQKKSQENLVLGRFGRKLGSNTNRVAGKRKAEDRVLKSIEGHFRNGVLNVKHLVKPTSSRDIDSVTHGIGLGEKKKKKESGKKSRGKKKGGKKRH